MPGLAAGREHDGGAVSGFRILPPALGLIFLLTPAPATGQSGGSTECAQAQAEITRNRLGQKVPAAVAVGRTREAECKGDDDFLLAYALARIDLAKQVNRSDVEDRTATFNDALADLELVAKRVSARRSTTYEIFGILGNIYYETKQYEKAIALLNAAAPVFPRLNAATQRTILFTRGQAEYQLGRYVEARHSFTRAARLGHPEAAKWLIKSAGKL